LKINHSFFIWRSFDVVDILETGPATANFGGELKFTANMNDRLQRGRQLLPFPGSGISTVQLYQTAFPKIHF